MFQIRARILWSSEPLGDPDLYDVPYAYPGLEIHVATDSEIITQVTT